MMKKVVFVHDHKFYKNGKDVYSGGGLPDSAWDRYLRYFDSVTVLARFGGYIDQEKASRLALTSKERVEFELCEGLSGLKERIAPKAEIKDLVRRLVSEHDAVVARLSSELGLLAISEARKQGKRYAIELVECTWDAYWNYGKLSAKVYAPFMFHRVRKAVKQAPMVLYVTNHFLQNRYPTEASVVASCSNVNIPFFDQHVLESRLKKLKEEEKDEIVFGIIGGLSNGLKGFDLAFKALSSLEGKIKKFSLRILGGGDALPWKKIAQKYGVEDKVFFDGVLPSGDPVFNWLDSIDIYLHPSYREGLPRAVIEAMGRGCPVLASSVAGTPELLSKDYLFQSGDAKRLAELIYEFSSDKSSLIKMSVDNFNSAKNFSLPELMKTRNKFYSNLI